MFGLRSYVTRALLTALLALPAATATAQGWYYPYGFGGVGSRRYVPIPRHHVYYFNGTELVTLLNWPNDAYDPLGRVPQVTILRDPRIVAPGNSTNSEDSGYYLDSKASTLPKDPSLIETITDIE